MDQHNFKEGSGLSLAIAQSEVLQKLKQIEALLDLESVIPKIPF
jgi:hypothetical protein